MSRYYYEDFKQNESSHDNPYQRHMKSIGHRRSTIRTMTETKCELKGIMRKLWEQHDVWTRATIMSIVMNLPDLKYVQDRLLRNPIDMGNSLKPFYGEQIGNQYATLIKEHLVLAAQLVTAAKAGDTKTASAKEKEWYRNADDIARFLSLINPYIKEEAFRQMMYQHLGLVKVEAVAFLEKNYQKSVSIYDQIEKQTLMMADVLTNAIIMQFPRVFIN